jgi:hypothetical protein
MIEEKVWSNARAGRGLDTDNNRDEPSHIHLPRRRRTVRLDDRGNIIGWSAGAGEQERAPHTDP